MNNTLRNLSNSIELAEFVDEIGFLPLLGMGIERWSAEEQTDEECGYTLLPEGGWEWPLWEWKGAVIQESGCAYGKFFLGKAGFVSRAWWTHFCNWRRSRWPRPVEGSIEAMILATLQEQGSQLTRELRKACGFTERKERSKFDSYLTRLEMGCHIVTEDFIYPHTRQGKRYGWGWSLLTSPEALFGREACRPDCSPEHSYSLLAEHFHSILPKASEATIKRLLG